MDHTATTTNADSYDPNQIISNANHIWNTKKDLDGAARIYQSALLEWGDDVIGVTDISDDIRDSFVSLYLSYANLYRKAKQFKSCEEAYEQALQDSIVATSARLWLDYARFCEERERFQAAKKVYLRALKVVPESETLELWEEFHRMVLEKQQGASSSPTNLSMEELKAAVQAEIQAEEEEGMMSRKRKASVDGVEQGSEPDVKKVYHSGPDATISNSSIEHSTTSSCNPVKRLTGAQLELSLASMGKKIEAEANNLLGNTFPPELSAAWMAKDGGNVPIRVTPLLFQSKPPSTETASGKDVVGVKVALEIVQLLLDKSMEIDRKSQVDDSQNELDKGSIVLELVKSCWAMTALFELKSKELMDDLEMKLRKEYSLVSDVVEEKQAFQSKCQVEFNKRAEYIAWESRKLLATQQALLKFAGIPNMDHAVDENEIKVQRDICAVLHSAFMLRDRIGPKAHEALLMNNEKKLAAELSSTASQQNIQQHVPMPIVQPPPSMSMMQVPYFQPPPQFFPHQQPLMGIPPVFQQPMQMPPSYPPNMPLPTQQPQQHPHHQFYSTR